MTRPEASLALLALGATTPGLAGCHLVEAGQAFATGSAEVRANVKRAVSKVATTLRFAAGPAADAYGKASDIMAEVW